MAGDRVRAGEYAERVNAAAELAEAGVPVAEAARVLAGRFGCSQRQARRYAERAAASGRIDAPQATTVFTVKLPVRLAAAVRADARASGRTISAGGAVVALSLRDLAPAMTATAGQFLHASPRAVFGATAVAPFRLVVLDGAEVAQETPPGWPAGCRTGRCRSAS